MNNSVTAYKAAATVKTVAVFQLMQLFAKIKQLLSKVISFLCEIWYVMTIKNVLGLCGL